MVALVAGTRGKSGLRGCLSGRVLRCFWRPKAKGIQAVSDVGPQTGQWHGADVEASNPTLCAVSTLLRVPASRPRRSPKHSEGPLRPRSGQVCQRSKTQAHLPELRKRNAAFICVISDGVSAKIGSDNPGWSVGIAMKTQVVWNALQKGVSLESTARPPGRDRPSERPLGATL